MLYSQENTTGYTDAELASLNEELTRILGSEISSSDLNFAYLNEGERQRIIKKHNDEVSGR